MGGKQSIPMEERILNVQFTARQLGKLGKKAEKDAAKEKRKVKGAIEKENSEGAKIYAENTIRKEDEREQCLRLASKLQEFAPKMKRLDPRSNRDSCWRELDEAMESMDIERLAVRIDEMDRRFGPELEVYGPHWGSGTPETQPTPADRVESLLAELGLDPDTNTFDPPNYDTGCYGPPPGED